MEGVVWCGPYVLCRFQDIITSKERWEIICQFMGQSKQGRFCCCGISKRSIVAKDVKTRADDRVEPPVKCGVICNSYPGDPGSFVGRQVASTT